jgi:hypothetical protein
VSSAIRVLDVRADFVTDRSRRREPGAYPNGSYPADNARQEAQDRRSMTVTSFDMLAGLVSSRLIVTVLAVKRWDD